MKKSIALFLILSFLFGCKKETKNDYSKQNSSDLFLNEKSVDSFFNDNPKNKSTQEEVFAFYKKRNFKYAWFNQNKRIQAVAFFNNQLQSYSSDFNDTSFPTKHIDSLLAIENPNKKQMEHLELLFTSTYFAYSKKVYGGLTKNPHNLEWFIPLKKNNYQSLLDSLLIKNKKETYEPVNLYYTKLLEKLKLYRIIQKKGGFPSIKTDKKLLSINDSDSCIVNVKQRLFLSGDLKQNDNSILFTSDLQQAVTHYQQRLGLPENGAINSKTLIELNKTVDYRIKQMIINLERLRWVPIEIEKDYILVNIPEYKLHVFENKKLIWEANVVVGKEAKQTNIFKGSISQVVFNPYWNIPKSIINKEILPHLKRDRSYLVKNNMEVMSGKTVIDVSEINWNKYATSIPFDIRQKPGTENSLGRMKFLFPNSYSIYLHDTPSKELFNQNKRDFSHGCIRVENPKKLAMYLLKKNKSWNEVKMDSILKTITETKISVQPTIPVYITYFTAWVDSKGNLNFRNDIYDLDKELAKEIFSD